MFIETINRKNTEVRPQQNAPGDILLPEGRGHAGARADHRYTEPNGCGFDSPKAASYSSLVGLTPNLLLNICIYFLIDRK